MQTIDDIFNQCRPKDGSEIVAQNTQDVHTTEFPANVILCADDEEYLQFTAKNKSKHETVFDLGYAMIQNSEDSLKILPDVRDFINNFAQFCEMRLKCPLAAFIKPYENNTSKETFVYLSTFIDCKGSISKLLTILSDIRSMQQHLLREENTKSPDLTKSPLLNGHSMTITLSTILTPEGTKPFADGRPLSLDSGDRFIDRVYEMRYAKDDYLRERSLKTADFNYVIDMVSDDLTKSGIFGSDKKIIRRDVYKWFQKARLWKLEYRR